MYTKLVLFLATAVTVVVTTPARLGDLRKQSFGSNSFSRRTLGGLNESPNLRGAYSFKFETPEGIKRQEEGKPQAPAGAVAQTGRWSFTYPDGSRGTFKFVADDKGFRLLDPAITPEERLQEAQAKLKVAKVKLEDARAKAHQRAESRRRLTFARP